MNQGGYKQVQIKTANKGQLIVMLYQTAIRSMKKALMLLDKKDMEGKGKCLIKAQDIILELLYALDQEMIASGNELALNLQRLYLYAYRQLIKANIQSDPSVVEEVIGLLDNLLGAWEELASSDAAAAPASLETSRVVLRG